MELRAVLRRTYPGERPVLDFGQDSGAGFLLIARSLRMKYPGKRYHVSTRGDGRYKSLTEGGERWPRMNVQNAE